MVVQRVTGHGTLMSGTPYTPDQIAVLQKTVPFSDNYWATHIATTPEEANQKLDAYQRAAASGIKGQPYLSQDELALLQPTYSSGIPNFITAESGTPYDQTMRGSSPAIPLTPGQIGYTPVPGGAGGAAGGGATAAGGAPGAPGAPVPGTEAYYLQQALQQAQQQQAQTQGYISGTLTPQSQAATDAANLAIQQRANNLAASGNLVGAYGAQNQNILNTLGSDFGNQNQIDLSALQNFQGTVNQANAADSSYMGNMQSMYNSMGQLTPSTSWAGDLTSQAAQAYADPASIAAQQQALGQLQGAAGGSLNYSSQAAQAYANPEDIANQKLALGKLNLFTTGESPMQQGQIDTLDMLKNYISGNSPMQRDQANALAQLQDYIGGNSATQKPELDAMDRLKGLSTPEVTDAERFIYEQARLKEEQDSRASREAIMRDRSARGMAGSGDELAAMLQANQGAAQNRVLTDLGAGANATARAMQALEGYGNMAQNYSGQGLQAMGAYGNIANTRAGQNLQAMGAYGDVSNTMAGQALDASNMYGGLASNMRNAGFNEAYARGTAADQASQWNGTTQLNAMNMSGNLASNMRNSSFNEAFSRGTAADQTAQYNRTTSLGVSAFLDNYAAQQQVNQWNRTTDLTNSGLQSDANYSNRGYQLLSGTQAGTAAMTGRSQALANAGATVNNNNLGAGQWLVGQSNNNIQAGQDAASQLFGRSLAIGSLGASTGANNTSSIMDAYGKLAGGAATQTAINSINQPSNNLFGILPYSIRPG
jgi:hypothetical protein